MTIWQQLAHAGFVVVCLVGFVAGIYAFMAAYVWQMFGKWPWDLDE